MSIQNSMNATKIKLNPSLKHSFLSNDRSTLDTNRDDVVDTILLQKYVLPTFQVVFVPIIEYFNISETSHKV